MMRNYQHKHEAARQLVAIQVTERNASEIAEWCSGREVDSTTATIEVPVQGGASTVLASEGDYVLQDSNHDFHVRSKQVFEAKYTPTSTQDQEIDFEVLDSKMGDELNQIDFAEQKIWPDDHLNNDGYIESDEKGYIPSTPDELEEDQDEDARLQ
jgi:hypothetical protein